MAQKLLLVNSTIRDTNVLADACLPNVSFVLYDYATDTYESLLQKIADLGISKFDEVGFIFHGLAAAPTFKLLNSQIVDSLVVSSLDTWSELSGFLNTLKTSYAVQIIDFFACDFYSNPNWEYVLNTLEVQVGIHIRASTDETGNMANGGNWIMESDNINIQSIYFNDNIADYQFTFGTSLFLIILATDGNVYGCGRNNLGPLGIGNTTTPQTTLVQMTTIPIGKTPRYISCGDHTIVSMTDYTIYGCGSNSSGELGIGNTTSPQTSLVQMTNSTGKTPKYVICGKNHTIVLMTDNTIYGCGNNGSGALGNSNTTTTQTSLVQMTNMPVGKTPKSISCGSGHTIVLMRDNTIYGCGYNYSGVLGIGTRNSVETSLVQMTNNTGKTPKSISCGVHHTVVLMTDGTVYVAGWNFSNTYDTFGTINTTLVQMTNNTGKTPKSVSCGSQHTIVLMTDNTIYGYGVNNVGNLGIGAPFLLQSALVQMTNMPVGKTPKSISCGNAYTIVLMTDNTIYVCGDNANGALGIGNTTDQRTLVPMTTNGTIYASLLPNQIPNYLPTGSVTISGTAAVGQTLTASNTLADLDWLDTISYQWKSNGTSISGATGSTYVLLLAHAGTTITVTASYTDGAGNDESVTSSATSAVSGPPSAPTGVSATPGNLYVSIAFTAGSNGGSAITNYKYSTDNGTSWITRTDGQTTSSPVIITKLSSDGTTNLSNGTPYTILLQAVNVAGDGTASSAVLAIPYPAFWLDNSLNTNLIKSVYLKGFVDVSGGDIVNRNGNLNITGNSTLNGNVFINKNLSVGTLPSYPVDVSGNANFRNNLYVGSDVSLNGRLFSGGDVSMNRRLYVAGGITTTSLTNTSDYRVKQNIQSLADLQLTVDALRPVFYDNQLTNKPEFGLIAHELQQIFPFAVNGIKDGPEYQSVNYIELVNLLIHEIQQIKNTTNGVMAIAETIHEKQQILDDLQKQINELKNKN